MLSSRLGLPYSVLVSAVAWFRRHAKENQSDASLLVPLGAQQIQYSHTAQNTAAATERPECMQGNCTEAPPAELTAGIQTPPLAPLQPGQCLIATRHNALAVRGQMWLHNLYFRAFPEASGDSATDAIGSSGEVPAAALKILTLSEVPGGAELWMTGCTLQADVEAANATGATAAVAVGMQVAGTVFAEGALRAPALHTPHYLRIRY